jgi:hypothetical protein
MTDRHGCAEDHSVTNDRLSHFCDGGKVVKDSKYGLERPKALIYMDWCHFQSLCHCARQRFLNHHRRIVGEPPFVIESANPSIHSDQDGENAHNEFIVSLFLYLFND